MPVGIVHSLSLDVAVITAQYYPKVSVSAVM